MPLHGSQSSHGKKITFFGTVGAEFGIVVAVNVSQLVPGGSEKLIHPFDPIQN
jgi:hypothetical protein